MSKIISTNRSVSLDDRWLKAKEYIDTGRAKNAMCLLKTLAEEGTKEAYFELGNLFERDDTEVSQDLNMARHWYMKAIEDYDDPYGYFGLARLALKNFTDAGALSDAIEYLQIACDKEDIPPALTLLGILYQEGKGLPRDLDKAVELYKRAIAKGYIAPIIYLSRLHWERNHFLASLRLRFKAIYLAYKIAKKDRNDPRLWNYFN